MRIVVCLKQSASGELNPLDACAYEAALSIEGAEVIIISMGPNKSEELLLELSRLGAARSILICDRAFAGSDTLATAYVLSLAIKKLSPDLVFCGNKTVDGETGQVGIELAQMLSFNSISRAMSIDAGADKILCKMRNGEVKEALYPALVTVERINTLRLPSIFSRAKEVEIWDAEYLSADTSLCGLNGSATKVLKSEENLQDRRSCKKINASVFFSVLDSALNEKAETQKEEYNGAKMRGVWAFSKEALEEAEPLCEDIKLFELDDPEKIAQRIEKEKPQVILWASDDKSKEISSKVAAILGLGLCADCTALETDGNEMFFYRPAFSGSVVAKIKCTKSPAMATLRTKTETKSPVVVGVGMGVKGNIAEVEQFANKIGADMAASRAIVDSGALPYEMQVGVTGRSISPEVYIAIGISGAVHHISGIRTAKTIIAINPDKDAPIFDFADYGIVMPFEDFLKNI